jgi:hypothetical protein
VYDNWAIGLDVTVHILHEQHQTFIGAPQYAIFSSDLPFIYVAEEVFKILHQTLWGSESKNNNDEILNCNSNFPGILVVLLILL